MEISTTTISRHSSFLYSKNLLLPRSLPLPITRLTTSNISLITRFHNPNPNPFVLRRRPSSIAMPLQVQSSALGAPEEGLEASAAGFVGENDLLIVGPGVLGRIVADKWRQEHPGCQISGLTMTTDHHDELIKIGISPSVWESKEGYQFPHVIFCAPPSRSVDYPGDVRRAASSWNGEGSFLFTSSSAAYDCNDNGLCDEDSPIVPVGRSPRTDVLLKAENAVLEVGGCVLRLAGLYKLDRGAHVYWLKKGIVDARPDHILNLIHYEVTATSPFSFILIDNAQIILFRVLSVCAMSMDASPVCSVQVMELLDAASLMVAILKKKFRGRIFLGCDNQPLSRQDVMELVNRSGKFSKKFEGFTGTADSLGKSLNNSKTRAEIGWEPKYSSFVQFLGLSE